MGARATLNGFPEVVAVDVFQGSGSKPGQIVVDTLVRGSTVPTDIPRGFTTLTIGARSGVQEVSIEFTDIRMVKLPRQYGAFMRTVWEDSRWKLHEAIMPENYNSRDCEGTIYPDTEQTVTGLIQKIADASGLVISGIELSLPTYKPSAPWRGWTAAQALDDLLYKTCSRVVYAGGGAYNVLGCNTGDLPDLGERIFSPVPQAKYTSIRVQTAPITYEKKFQCEAVVWNEDNETEVVQNPERIFNNFVDIAEVRLRSKYIHSAMRLWKPDDEDVILLGRRALTVAPGDDDSTYAAMVFTMPELAEVPMYGHLTQPHNQPYSGAPNQLSLTGGGKIFQCEQAHLIVNDDGEIQTTAEVLSAYHKIVSNQPERMSSDIPVGGEGGMLKLYFDWIRPVDTTESDIDPAEWPALLGQVEERVELKYTGNPQHVTIPTVFRVFGAQPNGKIGGVRYVLKLGSNPECYTVLAINYDPTDARMM
jgi:hypothetical protein